MSLFNVLRTIFLVLFIFINTAICAVAAVNISSSASTDPLRPVDGYMIFYSSASILFLFPMILVDVLRQGALTSKVWFECVWLFVAALLNIIGAATETMALTSCMAKDLSCAVGRVLLPITWSATFLVLAQLALVVVSSTYYSRRHPDIWTSSIREFQFFNGGGSGGSASLASGPPTPSFVPKQLYFGGSNAVPRLEQMAERWPTAASSSTKTLVNAVDTNEPHPLTLEYAPELPMRASAAISVGILPERRPSKSRKPAPALYPANVQIAINASSPPKSSLSPPLPARTATTDSGKTSDAEPLPIQNWPRANPYEASRKDKSSSRVAPASPPSPSPSPDGIVARRARGLKHRPPPLDLSAALPVRIK